MKPLSASEIKGNWATLLLPINPDDSIDFNRLGDELAFLTSVGVDGIYSNGTAGEFYSQSEAEFDRVNHLLAEYCERAGIPFQIGAAHMSAQISLERIKRAKALQPSAIQVILPDWQPLADAEVITCLTRFAEEAHPVGLVLYNPPQSKRVLKPVFLAELLKAVPNLVGIKVADGDDGWYSEMREYANGLSIFVPGHHLASGYRRGAAGAYSNVACLHPVGAQRWTDLMKTDFPKAFEIEVRLRQFFDEYITPFITERRYSNQAVDKLLAAIGGWAAIGTRLRFPYQSIDPHEAERLRVIARKQIPELFPDEGL
ncbi:MAG: dihydrodipicolinate synthase family protein [Chloroflexi bacterium]|nr:dihydrodipicolinate synthase family protein [Chloroflexota bacterium]